MLQRIHDSLGKWIVVIVLGLIAASFIFWNVDFGLTGATFAAKVNGEEIPLLEFERATGARINISRSIAPSCPKKCAATCGASSSRASCRTPR